MCLLILKSFLINIILSPSQLLFNIYFLFLFPFYFYFLSSGSSRSVVLTQPLDIQVAQTGGIAPNSSITCTANSCVLFKSPGGVALSSETVVFPLSWSQWNQSTAITVQYSLAFFRGYKIFRVIHWHLTFGWWFNSLHENASRVPDIPRQHCNCSQCHFIGLKLLFVDKQNHRQNALKDALKTCANRKDIVTKYYVRILYVNIYEYYDDTVRLLAHLTAVLFYSGRGWSVPCIKALNIMVQLCLQSWYTLTQGWAINFPKGPHEIVGLLWRAGPIGWTQFCSI